VKIEAIEGGVHDEVAHAFSKRVPREARESTKGVVFLA
jgi:hypothetical protein